MCFEHLLVPAGHAGDRLSGLLGDDERVPRSKHEAGEPGGEDGVVDVGDDAEVDVVADDLNLRDGGTASRPLQRDRVPAGFEPRILHANIDVATTVGIHWHHGVPDVDRDRGVDLAHREKVPPSPPVEDCVRGLDDAQVFRRRQCDPGEDSNLFAVAITRVRQDRLLPIMAFQDTVEDPVDPIFDPGSEEGAAAHGFQLSGSWAEGIDLRRCALP